MSVHVGYVLLERAVEKKVKLEIFELKSLKLERVKRSLKGPSEVRKNRAKLEIVTTLYNSK